MNILSEKVKRLICNTSIRRIEDRVRSALKTAVMDPIVQEMIVELYGPEYGWIDLKLSSEGQDTLHIEISDLFNPFPGLRVFLEQMMTMDKEPVEYLFDSERYNTYFRCESLSDTNDRCLFIACTDLDADPVFKIIGNPKGIAQKLYAELIHFMSGDHVNGPDIGCWWEPQECVNTEDYESREEEFDKNEKEGSPRWANHDIILKMLKSDLLEL